MMNSSAWENHSKLAINSTRGGPSKRPRESEEDSPDTEEGMLNQREDMFEGLTIGEGRILEEVLDLSDLLSELLKLKLRLSPSTMPGPHMMSTHMEDGDLSQMDMP